jgi:hypothetical protein
MARSLVELVETTQSDLLASFVDTLMKTDEFTAALIANAGVTDKPSIKFNRLASVPTPVYADCSTEFSNQAISGAPTTVNLLTMAVQFNTCQIGQNLYSSFTDVLASEVDGALKGLSHKILADSTGAGNGSSAILGLDSVSINAFNCATSGAVDVGDLDRMIDEVKDRANDCYFVGAPATIRKVLAELRSESGGMVYQDLAGTAMRVPQYLGYSILKAEGVGAGKLYFVNPRTGYKLFFGTAEDMPIGGVFAMQDLGNSQTKLEKLWRIYAHIAGISFNPLGIAELDQVV